MIRTLFPKIFMGLFVALLSGCGATDPSVSDPKVVGGVPVAPGDFAAVVGLAFGQVGDAAYVAECTGTLIAPSVVLTAGHCVDNKQDVVVYTGDGQDDALVPVAAAHRVASKAVHAQLRRYPLGYADFALLTLEEPLEGITPLPFVTTLAERLAATTRGSALLVGYGRREDARAGRKFQAEARIHAATSTEAVVGGDGKDACAGDSGGPALTHRPDGSYALLGVVSRGLGLDCGSGGYAGLTSDVACWIAGTAGLALPAACTMTAPAYSDADLARADFLRLCSGKNANPTQKQTIAQLMLGLGYKTCREAAAKLAATTALALDGLMLQDLSPLARQTQLESLSLTGNRVRDLAPLKGLHRLKSLKIDGNDVADPSALAALEARGLLVLGKRRQLGNYFQTDFLKLCQDQATPDAPRKTIKAVFWVTMAEDCEKANERLLGVSTLRLADRGLTDLSPLAGLLGLESLDLSRNPLASIEPLAGVEQLSRLDLSATGITDVAPLAPLVARGLVIKGLLE